jgi:autotransporter-associated beta strand protein
VTVNAANTYSGATVIDAGGTWYANGANNGGLPAGTALTVNGTLDMVDRTITVGALAGAGIVDRTYNGGSAQTLTVGSNNTSTVFSGVIKNSVPSYPVSLTKIGSGMLTLSGANTYTGPTRVNAGGFIGGTGGSCVNSTIIVAAGATNGVRAVEYGGQWACAGLTYRGGVACLDFDLTTLPLSTAFASLIVNGDLSVTGSVDVVVRNGYWPVTGTYPLVSYSGSLNGSGSFNLVSLPEGVTATLINNTGAKRLDLNVTTVPSVSLQTSVWTNLVTGSASGIWGVAANWTNGVPDGTDAIADFSTLNITANSTINNESPHMVGTLRFGDKTTADRDWTITNSTLTLATSLGFPTIDVSNRSVTIGTALLGTQGFCKTGAGQLNIDQKLPSNATGSNTYSGGTYIMAGTLMFGTFNNNYITGLIGPGTVYLGDSSGSANVVLQSQYGSYSLANNIVLLSGNTGTMQINNNGGGLTLSGTITLGKANGSGKSLTLGKVSTGGLTINGVIQDPVGMTPGTAGTVTIASPGYVTVNAANTYSGATVIDAGGTWYANGANNGGLPAGTALTVNGTLDMVDRTIKVGSLAGTGIVDRTYNGGSAQTLIVGSDNTSTVFSGVIKNSRPSYPVSFTKRGSGMLTLAGTNTYTGTTAVSNGTLAVSGALSSSAVTVCTGAAFAAGSTGIVGRATLGGTLTFQNSSALLVDVAPPLADAVEATGNVVIGTGVEVRLSGNQEKSGSWELIKTTTGTVQGSDPVLINGLHGAKLSRTATAIVLTIPPRGTMIRVL